MSDLDILGADARSPYPITREYEKYTGPKGTIRMTFKIEIYGPGPDGQREIVETYSHPVVFNQVSPTNRWQANTIPPIWRRLAQVREHGFTETTGT